MKARSYGPDMFWTEGRLCPGELTLVPRLSDLVIGLHHACSIGPSSFFGEDELARACWNFVTYVRYRG